MSRRLIALFALIVFTLTGLGLPALASGMATDQPQAEAACHDMAPAYHAKSKAPAPHSDCDGMGCHCALSHCPATLLPPQAELSEPAQQRLTLNIPPQTTLTATPLDTLKRPPRA